MSGRQSRDEYRPDLYTKILLHDLSSSFALEDGLNFMNLAAQALCQVLNILSLL